MGNWLTVSLKSWGMKKSSSLSINMTEDYINLPQSGAGPNVPVLLTCFWCLICFLAGAEYDDDLNDEISVQQILRDMLDKKVVEKEILDDLGFDGSKKRKDPRPKMELRHKQVLKLDF